MTSIRALDKAGSLPKGIDFGFDAEIPVNEFFPTIQGEAKYTGTPALFIRLQGCPVGCGFCDTKYTWDINKEDETKDINEIIEKKNLDHSKSEGNAKHKIFNVDELLQLCIDNQPDHIVFTGGEPCMHNLRGITTELDQYTHKNRQKRFTTQIETSGTFKINCDPRTWVTLSPKINMAGGLDVLKSSYERADEIKFPIGKQKHIDTLLKLVDDWYFPDHVQIWLQPLSQSKKATELCVETAMKHNFKLSLQTHKYANVR